MITSLSLENWKSHSKSRFDFASGTNILLGRMGSGKSSVLDALCFALYGTFPKMSRRDQTIENIVNMDSGAEWAEVAVEFEKAGQKYTIIRRIGKKISEAEVRLEGKMAQKGPKQVTDYVTSVLGVDYELFTRAIYSEQNRMDHLLSLNPRSRKTEIDWLLGLGQFDTAREEAGKAALRLSEQAEMLAADSDPAKVKATEAKIDEISNHLSKRKAAMETIAKRMEEARMKLAEKETAFSALSKTREQAQKEKSACEILRGAIGRLNKESEGKTNPTAEDISAATAAQTSSEKRLIERKEQQKRLQAESSALKSEFAVAESKLKLAQSRVKRKAELAEQIERACDGRKVHEIRAICEERKSALMVKTAARERLLAENAELEKAVDALSSGRGRCPVCDSDLSGGKATGIGREKKGRMEKNIALAAQHLLDIEAMKKEIAALEKGISDIDVFRREIARLDAEGAEEGALAQGLAALSSRKDAKADEAEKVEREITLIEKEAACARERASEIARSAKVFEELKASQERLAASEKALAGLNFDETLFEALRWDCNALRVELAKMQAESAGEGKQLALLSEMLALETRSISSLKEKARISGEYSKAAQSMSIYKNSLSATQTELRLTLVGEINQALAEIWPSVYPYSDYTGVMLQADEKDYRLLLQKGEWLEVDSIASGGERACLCLALRIAFATVLTPDIGWLILDEPTHNLDSEAVLMLAEAIGSKIPSIVEQTFVITHESALGESVSGKVFRLERDKSKNEATKVTS
ncbi:MAG: SMC family ATPase [Candidatus Micrarchaeia archaeon]